MLVTDSSFQNETEESQIITSLKAFLGDDAKIQIEYTNDIPVLQSGKRKCVVNLMKK